MTLSIRAVLAAFTLLSLPALAETPPGGGFSAPIGCKLGEECWVVNHTDLDSSPAARDFRCGHRTYDGHDGTDFAIAGRRALEAGVPVLAGADGVVIASRDGEPDHVFNGTNRAQLQGKECGNRVGIDHGDGWLTDHCHLRRGSVRVKPGDKVKRGDVLGMVGQSGWAEFPHVHFSVIHNKRWVDPYTGRAPQTCGQSGASLWRQGAVPEYQPFVLFTWGLAPGPVAQQDIYDGKVQALGGNPPALVAYGAVYGPAKGDRLRIRIFAPDGGVWFEHQAAFEKDQARRLDFAGKKAPPGGFEPGLWKAEISISRNGTTITRSAEARLGE